MNRLCLSQLYRSETPMQYFEKPRFLSPIEWSARSAGELRIPFSYFTSAMTSSGKDFVPATVLNEIFVSNVIRSGDTRETSVSLSYTVLSTGEKLWKS